MAYEPTKIEKVFNEGVHTGFAFYFDVEGQEAIINVTTSDHTGATDEETTANIAKYVQETLETALGLNIPPEPETPVTNATAQEEIPVDEFKIGS